MESGVPNWPVKHNWRYIARETPPKRPAGERICDFDEIYGLFDEATARAQASRCINCPEPQCVKNGCPLANRIPEWLALTAEGRFLEAAALSRSTSNMNKLSATQLEKRIIWVALVFVAVLLALSALAINLFHDVSKILGRRQVLRFDGGDCPRIHSRFL